MLLNGAEEAYLQGSHAFMKYHRWANDVVGFYNLEAMGSGGKEILFQSTSDSWVLSSYKQYAKYPFGSIIGQDLFSSGLLPADTDYRIFYGESKRPISGIDVAFVRNGAVYHTPSDDINHLDPGQIQHMGENVLSVVEGVLSHPFPSPSSIQNRIYFDIFGITMITFKRDVAIPLWNSLLIIAIGLLLRVSIPLKTSLKRCFIIYLFSFLSALILPCIVLYIMKTPYFWYSHPFSGVLVYAAVPFLIQVLLTVVIDRLYYSSYSVHERFYSHLIVNLVALCSIGSVLAALHLDMNYFFLILAIPLLLASLLLRIVDAESCRFPLCIILLLPTIGYFSYVTDLSFVYCRLLLFSWKSFIQQQVKLLN